MDLYLACLETQSVMVDHEKKYKVYVTLLELKQCIIISAH